MSEEQNIQQFYLMTAGPALEALTLELEKHGHRVYLHTSDCTASLTVRYFSAQEIRYSVEVQRIQDRIIFYPMYRVREGETTIVTEGSYAIGAQDEALSLTNTEIMNHFLEHHPPKVELLSAQPMKAR